MRKKKSWVMWCIVVALALLALAVPWLQVQGAKGDKVNDKGSCDVLDQDWNERTIDEARKQRTYDAGVLVKAICRGKLDPYDPAGLPATLDGGNPPGLAWTCTVGIYSTLNWVETISRNGMVTLTCDFTSP